jgi:phage replication O-like protein O
MAIIKKSINEPREIPNPETVEELTKSNRFLKVPWSLLVWGYLWTAQYLSVYEHALFWFVMIKTLGFKKEFDWLSHSQITKGTRIPRSKVSEVKKKMLEKHILKKDGKKIGIEINFAKWVIPINRGKRKGMRQRIKVWQETEVDSNGEENSLIYGRPVWVR